MCSVLGNITRGTWREEKYNNNNKIKEGKKIIKDEKAHYSGASKLPVQQKSTSKHREINSSEIDLL